MPYVVTLTISDAMYPRYLASAQAANGPNATVEGVLSQAVESFLVNYEAAQASQKQMQQTEADVTADPLVVTGGEQAAA